VLLAIAAFWLAAATGAVAGWSYQAWTGDADSGIDSGYTYTCKVNMNGGTVTINGVSFDAYGGTSGTGWSIGGSVSTHGGRGGSLNITGNSAALGNPFVYNGNPRTITLTGLTPGKAYRTTLYAFGWEASGRTQGFLSNGQWANIDQDAYGNNNGIRIINEFVAKSTTRSFQIYPDSGTFHMSGLANHEIEAPATFWQSSAWTGDADCGIDSNYTYTCAVNMNGAGVTVNGATFDAHSGVTSSGNGWSMAGISNSHGSRTTNVGGNSKTLSDDGFVYNGTPGTITLTGLTPGKYYETTLFAFGWGSPPSMRAQTFASGSDSEDIAQHAYGNNNGIKIQYTFLAEATTRTITITPTPNPTTSTFHLSALANREARRIEATNFARRMQISFSNYAGGTTLTNFPVLVKFQDGVNGFNYADMRADGTDLRFTDSDGVTELNYEIEEWDTSGTSFVWVCVPEFDAAASIYAYWGNDFLDYHADSQTDGSVWVADYAAVWHLDKVSGVEDLTDSTAAGHDGTDSGNSYTVTGVVGDGQRFDTSDGGDSVNVAYAASLGLNTYTISTWVQLASEPGNYGLLGTRFGGDQTFDVKARATDIHGDVGSGSGWIDGGVDIRSTDTGSNGIGGDLAVGSWHLVSYVIDNAAQESRLYIDGDLKRTKAFSGTPLLMKSGQSMHLGHSSGAEYMDGILDEMRVSAAARSTDWLLTSFMTQASNDTYCVYGTAESTGIHPVLDATMRMRIGFENYAGGETLTNFPAFVKLEEGSNNFSHADVAVDGTDLRFTAADGVTLLNYDIEEWNSSGTSYIWVQVPALNANAAIHAYWGSGRTLPIASVLTGSTWSQDYGGVWHLDEIGGTEDLTDSTANGNDPTVDNDTDNATGMIAMGQNFDGGTDYISIPDSPSLSVTGNLTMSGWVNVSSFAGGSQHLMAKDGNSAYRCRIQDGGSRFWMLVNDGGGFDHHFVSHSFTVGQWYHIAAQLDTSGPFMKFYVNGSQVWFDVATTKSSIADTGGAFLIGNYQANNPTEDFVGVMDEVRVSAALRSADWLHACWLNVASNRHFNSYEDAGPNWLLTADAASGVTDTSATFHATLEIPTTNADVYVYWGTTDGTNNASAWATNAYVGSWTNEASTNISFWTNVLSLSTHYYYTFQATNDSYDIWASPSADFYTFGKPGVDNAGGATGLGVGEATLNGRVVSTGGVPVTHVRIYFGDEDGGMDTGNWDSNYVFDAGSVTQGVPFSTNLTGLLYGVQYSYRTYASNSYGEGWADVETFTTLSPEVPGDTPGWSYAAWTGDANSGISNAYPYTAAHSFGDNHAGITVNGVPFSYSFASSGTGWSIGGGQSNWGGDDDAVITGNSEDLAEEFVYNGNPRTVQFSGLTLGRRYRATFFSVGWEASGRFQTFLSGSDSLYLDQDFYGNNNGITVSYVFDAAATTRDFSITPAGGTFHMYGLANREGDQPLVIGIDNAAAANVTSATADLVGTLYGEDSVFDVNVYWGTNDNANGAAWLGDGDASNASVGTYTNVTGHSVTGAVGSLDSGQRYYYTMQATNAATNVWASPNAVFYSLYSAADTPSNLTAQTGIERTIDLTWEESVPYASGFVVEYWKSTGPTSTWHVSGGDATNTTVTGLDHNTLYTFRVAATNSANGDVTAFSTTDTASTIPEIDPVGGADRRMRITFTSYTGDTLTNFPVLVVFSNGLHGFSYADCEAGGTDLRFTGVDGVTPINYEIESWGAGTDKSYVWVQVPEFSGSSVIWAYWGSGKPYHAASQTDGSVWSQDYAGVWHLDETDGVEDLTDSTAFDNDATVDTTDNIDGLIAKGQYFDGGSDYIQIPDSPSVSVTGDITLAAWIYGETFLGGSQNIIAKASNASYRYRIQQGGTVFWTLIKDAGALETESVPYAFESNTWYHAVTKVDFAAQEVYFYLNGTQIGTPQVTAKTGIADSPGTLLLGNYAAGHAGEDFIGIMDEVRITDGLRSADWINASYMTVASNSAFNAYEEAQTLVPNAPRLLIVDGATNVLPTSAYLTASVTSTGAAPTGVWLYWGESNEGDSWGTWDSSSNLGAVVSTPPVSYSELVTSLTPATQYYYAYRATNSYGEGWLSEPFKTGGPPEIDNGAGALVDVGIATLRGNLVATNEGATTVTVYWGSSNGGTDPNAWGNTNGMGVLGNGAFSTNTPATLLYGVTYYYRCYATNAYGGTWASSTESFTTPLPREANGWTTDPWNNDADSGITNDHTYTMAVNMKGAQVAIGGVSFQSHVMSGPNFSIGGPDSTFNNHVNNVTGDSAVMANDFIYGSPGARTLTLSNLTPGTQYRTTFFGVGFDAAASRSQMFSATGGDAVIQDENIYGQGNGMRQEYTFMADGSGSQAFTITEQVLTRSFHMYGLANRVVEPLVGIDNEDVTDVAESTATFNGTLSATGAVFDVYVYWGTSDGTNNPLAWGDSDYIGSYTNLETVALSYPATGLSVGTNYYTFRATNALIDMWAEPSEMFMSLGQPAIENVAASNAVGFAALKGNLTAGGVADVTVYWGPADGGEDHDAWAHTNAMGEILTGEFSTNTTSGLLYGLTYYYRCYATNSIGHDWANSSATFLTLSHSESTGWATNQWNDDQTADIDSSYTYNVAVNMAGPQVAVNGVTFLAHTLSGPDFSVTGLTHTYNNDGNNIVGSSATLANDFRHRGNPGTIVMTNLTEGAYYRTTFYGCAFGAPGSRVQTFDAEGDSADIDEHIYDNDNGMRASYTFRAGASGAKTYTITPHIANNTFHLYALSNRGVPLDEMLEVYNGDVTGLGTDTATFNGTLNASNAVYDVYVYWGTSNAGAQVTGWNHSTLVGSYTSVTGQALSHTPSLSQNTTYYYTFMASNAADVMWAEPSISLTTFGGPTVTNLPATGVTTASATLNGELLEGTSADVTIYWGLTDRGPTATGWDHTTPVGTVAVGTFSTTVTVRASGTYYYRCYAINAYGADWAAPVASFDSGAATLSIADASVSEGDSGTTNIVFDVTLSAACASNVTVSFQAANGTATVGTDLQSTNGTLQIDAGDTAGQIAAVVIGDLEVEQPSEAFNMNLSGLAGGPSFADSTAVGTILDEDIGVETARYKMKITFSGYNKVETLNDFPALVMLGTNLSNFGYDQFESPTGGDLRFANAGETELLDYEVEKWDVAGQSYVWVRIPELVDSSTYVWGYWGIAENTNAPPSTTNGSVWASSFEAVWHLGADGGVEDLTDATTNGVNLADNGDSVNATGKIGDGQYLDGTSDYLTSACPAALGGNPVFTVSWWIRYNEQPSRIWAMGIGTTGAGSYHGLINTGGGTQLGVYGGAQNNPNILAYRDTWLHMTTVHLADNTQKTYLNGIEADSDGGLVYSINAGGGFRIGQGPESKYKGDVDEVRLSNVARSTNWVWASWNNQAQNTSFCDYGAVDADPPAPSLFILR